MAGGCGLCRIGRGWGCGRSDDLAQVCSAETVAASVVTTFRVSSSAKEDKGPAGKARDVFAVVSCVQCQTFLPNCPPRQTFQASSHLAVLCGIITVSSHLQQPCVTYVP